MDGLVRIEGPGHLAVRSNAEDHVDRSCSVHRCGWNNVSGVDRLLNMHRVGLCGVR